MFSKDMIFYFLNERKGKEKGRRKKKEKEKEKGDKRMLLHLQKITANYPFVLHFL